MNRARPGCLALVLFLAASTCVLLALENRAAVHGERAEEFHRLVGGLGFGPALDLSTCEFGFDPRLCSACSHDCGPVPDGTFLCPHHTGSIFDYPPLAPRHEGVTRRDVLLP